MQIPNQWDPGQFIDLIYTRRLRSSVKRKEVKFQIVYCVYMCMYVRTLTCTGPVAMLCKHLCFTSYVD